MTRSTTTVAILCLLAGCDHSPPAATSESALAAKPQHTVSLTGITDLLQGVLADLYLQFDQTDDPTHGGPLTTRAMSCVPATAQEQGACRAQCPDLGDPNLYKACSQRCSELQDCTPNVCGPVWTSDYVMFGDGFKSTFHHLCNDPNDSCPACTVGQQGSVIEDVDLTSSVPDPIFSTSIVSCRLNTFGINLRNGPGFNVNDWVTIDQGDPFHIQVKAFASQPTVRCNIGISPTLVNPLFDFYLKTSVINHHPALGVVANFTSHVDYALDWVYSLDDRVNSKVTGTVNGILGRNQGKMNQELEKLLVAQIQKVNGEQVDDFLDVHFDGDSIVVVYTPLCVDGQCSCTPDCTGRQCGMDAHCNVSCGGCMYGTCDDASNTCQCTPKTCAGVCGHVSNGCGGFIYCPPCVCTPSCVGKKCGQSNGCGASCYGPCRAHFQCQDDGDGVKSCVYAN